MAARDSRSGAPIHLLLAGTVLALAVAAMLVQLAHALFGFASPSHDFLIEEWSYNFVTTAAAVLTLGRAVFRREQRLGWMLIGVGLLFWAASDNYWTLWLGQLDEPPFPSIADAATWAATSSCWGASSP